MATKLNPGTYDCYENAKPDEPMFVLLARDPSAPALVEEWARRRGELIDRGEKPESDRPMIAEALSCATAMREWRVSSWPPPATGS